MEAYLWAFFNFKENDWVGFLPIAKFVYNNTKNASIGHIPFELNCGYYLRMLYKDDLNSRSKSKSINKLSVELKELMIICWVNLYRPQEFQKCTYDKSIKPKSYAPGDKVWLNSKYIKIKQNQKLKAKFFKLFCVLYPMSNQAYKLKLPRK